MVNTIDFYNIKNLIKLFLKRQTNGIIREFYINPTTHENNYPNKTRT